jgi:hypothetical protein
VPLVAVAGATLLAVDAAGDVPRKLSPLPAALPTVPLDELAGVADVDAPSVTGVIALPIICTGWSVMDY